MSDCILKNIRPKDNRTIQELEDDQFIPLDDRTQQELEDDDYLSLESEKHVVTIEDDNTDNDETQSSSDILLDEPNKIIGEPLFIPKIDGNNLKQTINEILIMF